jgi:hypothetical protein
MTPRTSVTQAGYKFFLNLEKSRKGKLASVTVSEKGHRTISTHFPQLSKTKTHLLQAHNPL